MKRIIIALLFCTAALNCAEQTLAPITKEITTISRLSDQELNNLWQRLQAVVSTSNSQEISQKAKPFVDKIVKEKLQRSLKDKNAQKVVSKILFDSLVAIAFDGSALMLSGESVETSLYTAVIRQLTYSLSNHLAQSGNAAKSTALAALNSQLISSVLQLPSAGQGLITLDPVSALPWAAGPATSLLHQSGYTEKTISAFNKTRQAVADFFSSLLS